MDSKETVIFSSLVIINTLLAISGIWYKYYLHIGEDTLFYDPDLNLLIWISVAILIIDIVNFALIKRTGILGVIINFIIAYVGIFFMVVYALIPIGISEVPLILFEVIDIFLGSIALQVIDKSKTSFKSMTMKRSRSKR